MAGRIRAHDWAATPLGPIEAWPSPLRSTVDLLLVHGFPMVALWGPELVQIYNDPYRLLMADKHPAGLGQPTRACWPEAWHINAPIYGRVLAGETVTFENALHPLARRGEVEDVWLTLTYSPLRQPSCEVRGVLVTIVETTERTRTEAALKESERRFRQFAGASSNVLWIRNAETLVLEYVSPAAQATYGVPLDDLSGGFERWATLIVPADRKEATGYMEQLRRGETAMHEFRIRRISDDSIRWIKGTVFPILDEDGRVQRIGGIAEDVTEARLAAERQNVLVAELQHRTRNLLAVVKGVANDTMRETGPTEAFRAAFADRLFALSRVQGLLSRSEAEPITIGSLLRMELDAFGAGGAGGRVTVDGPEVFLRPSTVQTLALALHELATNARKYGALSHDDGRLAVTWREQRNDDEPRLTLDWTETGLEQAPERPAPGPRDGGYGRELIEQALPHALGARTSYALSASGVRCTIDIAVRLRKASP